LSIPPGAEFCEHCGAKVGEHRRVPWWHLHRRLYDWTLAWAYRPSAAVALAAVAFAESSCFPVPPDVLLIPMALSNRRRWFHYALLCSIASVIGGMFGYLIGYTIWSHIDQTVFRWFGWLGFTPTNFELVRQKYDENAFLAVFGAAFTPIPYKVFTVFGGVFKISFLTLVIASAMGRSMRFFLVAGLCAKLGYKVLPFIEKYFGLLTLAFLAMLIGGFLVVKYLL
jgi:membrane protein YqaA with SNARE-associated domain